MSTLDIPLWEPDLACGARLRQKLRRLGCRTLADVAQVPITKLGPRLSVAELEHLAKTLEQRAAWFAPGDQALVHSYVLPYTVLRVLWRWKIFTWAELALYSRRGLIMLLQDVGVKKPDVRIEQLIRMMGEEKHGAYALRTESGTLDTVAMPERRRLAFYASGYTNLEGLVRKYRIDPERYFGSAKHRDPLAQMVHYFAIMERLPSRP